MSPTQKTTSLAKRRPSEGDGWRRIDATAEQLAKRLVNLGAVPVPARAAQRNVGGDDRRLLVSDDGGTITLMTPPTWLGLRSRLSIEVMPHSQGGLRARVQKPSYRRDLLNTLGVLLLASTVSALWNGLWTLPLFLAAAVLLILNASRTRRSRQLERLVYEQLAPLELREGPAGFRELPADQGRA